ncbi:nicotinamide riboside transporter PnuC [Prevotella cerevisiae]|uniref:Nicotinamide riboside transporter PnuC n=1 Tax=Segatella cerevisiae TaxID=2053716 RepID=A0ABT1BXI9_9BACT|nr:nicotinamide riboside transporter PnuC [Segatella cerevisiae]MCO6025684.1 nicotinamide riboside transporter PnuC [Segatella cerevisiae]
MEQFFSVHWLDILTTLVGVVYVWLEYKASIWLWIVGIIMPVMCIVLYWQHGLYADFGMNIYYTLAAIYGYAVWKFGKKKQQTDEQEMPITHYKVRLIIPSIIIWLIAWAGIYWILIRFTNSNVPICDSFINSLSFIGLWALARKYLEQWFVWMAVDSVSAVLYVYKGIPFMAGLNVLYTIVSIAGLFKWKKMMEEAQHPARTNS